jgi:predicted acetyltransferase
VSFTIRAITDDEFATFRATIARGFGGDPRDEGLEGARTLIDPGRAICAWDDSELIGTLGTFAFDVTIPGGTLPMAGTTMVTVQPTHRRRGALKGMMHGHLKEIHGRGREPLAGLWASESSIYGRFGYGHAANGSEITLDGDHIHLLDVPSSYSVRYLLDEDERSRVLPAIHERARLQRPGILSRSKDWWAHRIFFDPEFRREGMTERRFAVAYGPDGAEGYTVFRQKHKWSDFPEGEVAVGEVFSLNRDAHLALWSFLTNIDLFPKVSYWNLPVDDILPWCIRESRRVVSKPCDSLWLRVMDVPAALLARTYSGSGRINIAVRDEIIPSNSATWVLDATPDGSTCEKTNDAADIEMDIEMLGAVYLGGQQFETLARAGRMSGTPEAVALADGLFRWSRAPWCPEVF